MGLNEQPTGREFTLPKLILTIIGIILAIIIGIGIAPIAIKPMIGIWQASMEGQAQLAKARYSKEVIAAGADAQIEAIAKLHKAAEQFKDISPEFLQYLLISAYEHREGDATVIIIPMREGGELPPISIQSKGH
jgi:hypothetical protein